MPSRYDCNHSICSVIAVFETCINTRIKVGSIFKFESEVIDTYVICCLILYSRQAILKSIYS